MDIAAGNRVDAETQSRGMGKRRAHAFSRQNPVCPIENDEDALRRHAVETVAGESDRYHQTKRNCIGNHRASFHRRHAQTDDRSLRRVHRTAQASHTARRAGTMFRPYLDRWKLTPDGEAITTPTSFLLPVRHEGSPAMLKLARVEEERSGAALMDWWEGDGAAPVLARDDDALLLERACSANALAEMARHGRDDEACLVLCAVAARLHAPKSKPLPKLVPLKHWFRELDEAAATHGGILVRCAATARELLDDPRDLCVLHGDLHHGNVLDFGP